VIHFLVENKQNLYVLNIKKNKLKGEESYKNEFN
jgi:tRNA-binding EMAP/Myf-like protein